MSTQQQNLEQCSADVRACREDIRKSYEATAQLNSKVDAVLRILGQQVPNQSTTAAAVEEPLKRARAAVAAASPLDRHWIFTSVLSYVGFGEYFYVAAVCRKWRGAYISFCHANARAAEKHKLRTKCSAIVVNTARLQLAFHNGAQMAQLESCIQWAPYYMGLGDSVVMWSLEPIDVLTLLRLYGYVWKESIYEMAAKEGKLSLMQWLHQVRCPMPPLEDWASSCTHSSSEGLGMLQWLHSLQPEWFHKLNSENIVNTTSLLSSAAENCNVAVIQWLLRELNAEWFAADDVICNEDGCTVIPAWTVEAVICALDNGLYFKFECRKLNAEKQTSEVRKEDATALWQWLHTERHMHRCTCSNA
jgi:hypothetical protein